MNRKKRKRIKMLAKHITNKFYTFAIQADAINRNGDLYPAETLKRTFEFQEGVTVTKGLDGSILVTLPKARLKIDLGEPSV